MTKSAGNVSTKDSTMTIDRLNVGKRLSDVVINRTSGTAYLAGQVADDVVAG